MFKIRLKSVNLKSLTSSETAASKTSRKANSVQFGQISRTVAIAQANKGIPTIQKPTTTLREFF